MKKFLAMLFAVTLVVACGKGREAASHEDEGEDDEQPAATASTSAAPAAAPVVSADAATINGLVKFEGTPAKPPALQMSADPFCQSQHAAPVTDEEVVVGPAGELANVILWIKHAPSAPPPQTAALLDQKGCQYIPHVQAIQVNQPLQIRNDDNTLHNVHAMPSVNSQFNEGQPVQGMVSTKKFDKPEPAPFKVKCDVHPWMGMHIAVFNHPFFAVTGDEGTFEIKGLPPGKYTVEAWHEKFGNMTAAVEVTSGATKEADFTFEPDKK